MASLLGKKSKESGQDAHFLVIYGTDGVGKTSFACGAGAASACVVGTETSAKKYGVPMDSIFRVRSHRDLIDTVSDLRASGGHVYKTLIIDALDGIEKLCEDEVCKNEGTLSVEEVPYGKGVPAAHALFIRFINVCEAIREEFKLNVIFIAHSHVKAMNDPQQPAAYDRHQLKLREKNAAYVREIVDTVLFATFETFVKTNKDTDKKGRGIGGEARVMFTERRAAFDAKNRDGLPFKMELSWKAYADAMGRNDSEKAKELAIECLALIEENAGGLEMLVSGLPTIMKNTVVAMDGNVAGLEETLNRIKAKVEEIK